MQAHGVSLEISLPTSPGRKGKRQKEQANARNYEGERSAAKTRSEAGATPPCRKIAAPVPAGFGGHSRLLLLKCAARVLAAKEFCRTDCMRRHVQPARQDCMQKGDEYLPLLKAQPKQPKSATIQIRVEEDVKLRLDKYAGFIDSSPAYVVTEALKLLFNKDGEFKSWLGQHTNNHNLHQIEGGSLTEIAKKA